MALFARHRVNGSQRYSRSTSHFPHFEDQGTPVSAEAVRFSMKHGV
jgi:hypothetical protein